MEEALRTLPFPVTFLRPAWFLENLRWDIAQAREQGVLSSYLQPLERAVPMVATADVGSAAAELLVQEGEAPRIVELEGPERLTQHAIAAALSQVLGRPVHAEVVPRETWGAIFRAQGMRDPVPRIQMLDGFNEGWIRFEGKRCERAQGQGGRVGGDSLARRLIGWARSHYFRGRVAGQGAGCTARGRSKAEALQARATPQTAPWPANPAGRSASEGHSALRSLRVRMHARRHAP